MAKKMLIDASHPEEMRMAIMDGKRLEGFETESFSKKQLKGSIYLAKVIRVEPSLQAAFVDFGGNRQGFLPFTEIHPDYYHIPVGDRLEDHVASSEPTSSAHRVNADTISVAINDPVSNDTDDSKESQIDDSASHPLETDDTSHSEHITLVQNDVLDDATPLEIDESLKDLEISSESVDIPADESDDFDEESIKKHPLKYRYKIQEVIKRRQVMLVQVVKEERGGKGAALTTYLSLPGRYCVLMPNSGERRGGISRKISDIPTRKRIRGILDSLDLLDGMSLIVRTAGSDKNKTEIRKDFEYLLRLWSDIREKTLTSIAPTCVYSEGDLIKRALRDAYTKDIEHVLIDGEEAYKSAKNLMKTMSPSQAKKVQLYKDKHISLFQHYHIEDMVDEMFQPTVSLPSGGSIVIAQTEALVAIDVNSGKATRERHITDTAFKTNIEAAKEVARQLRLRDLGGIIVIDFIDMSDRGHIAQVEKIFKESLQFDRARIQLGKISQFGLLEMSRQRLRPSLMESSTRQCSHCHGTGLVRSIESMSLFILRQLEGASVSNPKSTLHVSVPSDVDTYLLNKKRRILVEFETKYDVTIDIRADKRLKNTEHHLNITQETGETTTEKDHDQKALEHHHSSHHKDGRHQNHKQHHHGARDDNRGKKEQHRQQHHKQSQEAVEDHRAIHIGDETSTVTEKNQNSVHADNTSTHEQKKRRNKRRRSSKKTMADAITADLMGENIQSIAPQITHSDNPSLKTATEEDHTHSVPSNENQERGEGKRRKRRRPDRRRNKIHGEERVEQGSQSPAVSQDATVAPAKEVVPFLPASLSSDTKNDTSPKSAATRGMNRKKKPSKDDISANKSNDKDAATRATQEKQKEPAKKAEKSDASKTAQNDGVAVKEKSKSKGKRGTQSDKTKSKKTAGTNLAEKRDIIVTKEEAHAPKTDTPSQDRAPKRKKGLWGRLFDTSEG